MSAGLIITNDDGTVIIDENFVNLCLRATGNTAGATWHGVGGTSAMVYTEVTYTGTSASTPLMFLNYPQPAGRTDAGAALIGCYASGNTWTFRICLFWDPAQAQPSTTINWLIYDTPIASDHGYGLEVFDADGAIKFSSLFKPLVLVAIGGDYSSLPAGTWAACELIGLNTWDDGGTEIDSWGNPVSWHVYYTAVSGFYCTSTAIHPVSQTQTGATDMSDVGYASVSSSSSLVVRVA